MVVGAAGSWLITPFIWSDRFENWPNFIRILVTALIISVPISLTIYLFYGLPDGPIDAFGQYASVVLIAVIITGLFYFAERYAEIAADAPSDSDDPVQSFMERLPVKYRAATLYAIASEDHYLRVYTSLGEELILMRLADAVRELSSADGLQVHRSWWIARDGVVDAQRSDGRNLLILPSGVEVPVSRSFRESAKTAGLID